MLLTKTSMAIPPGIVAGSRQPPSLRSKVATPLALVVPVTVGWTWVGHQQVAVSPAVRQSRVTLALSIGPLEPTIVTA